MSKIVKKKNGIFWHFMTHGIFHNIDKIWHYGYQMNRLNNYNWYMKYENIFWIEFFTKNGNFAFDPFFLCIWAEIPLYLKYGESRVDLSSKVKFFAFSHYTIPTELHSIGKIWLAWNLVFLTYSKFADYDEEFFIKILNLDCCLFYFDMFALLFFSIF